MSWEVSSMPSKRSFFNRTLFRRNLSHSWPLWGLLSAAGAMVPLYILLELLNIPRRSLTFPPEEFASALYNAVTLFAPGFTAVYAILCAMLVWGYLYNSRSIGLFHALPVDRTCLFVTNTLSGLTMLLIPYAVTGFLGCLLAVCWGFFHLTAVLNTILAVIFLSVTFFGMATLCAMLTGNIFALPALYLLLNFLSPLLESLIFTIAQQFLVGINSEAFRFNVLSPIVQIYSRFTTRYTRFTADGGPTASLHGLWVPALYALAGLGMLALAWFLYRKRHSERAGDVVAFRWLRPVFRYGVALLGGLTIGRLLYFFLWENLFQKGSYADILPFFVCTALGGLLGCYAASMLLEKSRRVFRGSLPSAAIVCAGAAVLCLLVSMDVFGAERRVPDLEDVESVRLEDRGILSGPFTLEKDREQVEAVLAFHRSLVDDRAYIRSYEPNWGHDEGKVFSHYISLTYQLADGSTLSRQYDLWFTTERAETAGTYENLLSAFYEDPKVRRCDVTIPEGASLSSISISSEYLKDEAYGINTNDQNPEDAKTLYAALLRDADEGNVPAKDVLAHYGSTRNTDTLLCFAVRYRTPIAPWEGSWSYGYKDVYVHPQMQHTVDALISLGYMTEEDAARWAEDYTRDHTSEPRMESAVIFG